MISLLFEPKPVYFMHVPKTGGCSLGKLLRSAYAGGYFDLSLKHITQLTDRNVMEFRCYHDWHNGQSMFEWLGRPNLSVITMVRKPVERAISHFNFQLRFQAAKPEVFKPEFLAQLGRLSDAELSECLDDQLVAHIISNAQSRHLGNRRDYGRFLSVIEGYAPDAQTHALQFPEDVPQLMNEDDMPTLSANAHTWLSEMAFVGLTERYVESVLLMSDLLGIPVPYDLPRANVNPLRTDPAMCYSAQLAPDIVARLEELNRYDLELYDHANDLFKQSWARYRARPNRTYSIAASLRVSLKGARSGLKSWLRFAWPRMYGILKAMATAYRSQRRK